MMNSGPNRLKGALIGCGFVSQFHLEGWSRLPEVELIAVCDTNPARLERLGSRATAARRYASATHMFVENRLDFVEICTGPESHRELVELAARKGVHILCQKPAAFERTDLVAMIDECERAGVRLMFHENWRFRPWYRALRSFIEKGVVGRPLRLRIAHRDTRALRPDGFSDQPFLASRPRLILMEMGCHLMGEIRTVFANLGHFGQAHRGEDVATLSIVFENGSHGILDMTWCANAELARPEWALNETVVEGELGSLRLQANGSFLLVDLSGKSQHWPVELPPDDEVYVQGYQATQAHFIRGLVEGSEHETDGRDTLKTMDVVWAAYRSAEEGRCVTP